MDRLSERRWRVVLESHGNGSDNKPAALQWVNVGKGVNIALGLMMRIGFVA
jgi:hypothetical protein